jgi:flagellar biosynthesis/type III secretory pathway chaperone
MTELIDTLVDSYSQQVVIYRKLNDLVQRILGQLAMSRGDISVVMGLFGQKQQLLDSITRERERVRPHAEQWQNVKAEVQRGEHTRRLDEVLAEIQQAIQTFLGREEQLKCYFKTSGPEA